MNRVSLAAFAVFLACPALGATPADVEQRIRQFQQGLAPPVLIAGETPVLKPLADRMQELKIPGLSVAVIHQGRIDWARGFGNTHIGGPGVSDKTLFQAASISKPVFALAVLHLVDEGKLSLDANVNEYLKQWKLPENDFTRDAKVTLRGLLSHSAGLTVHGFPGYSTKAPVPTTMQVLDGAPPANTAAIRVDIKPKSRFRYSGGGYTVAQQILLDVTGVPLPKLLSDTVLTPLGMTHSTFEQPLPAKRHAEVALPYRADGRPVEGGPHTYPEMAAAGLWTTPTDLARYALGVHAALAGKSKVISASTARAMLTKVIDEQGMGPQLGGSSARKFFSHGGGNEGYRCFLIAYEDGEGAIVMTSSDNGGEVMMEVIRTIAHEYRWPDFAPPTRTIAKLNPKSLDRLAGVYAMGDRHTFVLRKVGSGWVGELLGNAPVAMLPSSELELFARDANVVVSFTPDDQGGVSAIKHRLNDWELTGSRVDDARSRQVLAKVEDSARRFQQQKPLAETEGVLRELIAGIAAGKPNYERMTPPFADFARRALPEMKGFVDGLGAPKKLTFKRVGPEGGDIYHVEFEKGVSTIELRFGVDGGIDYLRILPD
jgi:CubicO group peptidase (beta-lactamase class C family)